MTLQGIYAILDDAAYGDRLLPALDDLLDAGVRLFQYRAKNGIDDLVLERISERTRKYGATLLINDAIDAAYAAQGVHLGQEDCGGRSMTELRALLPVGHILGLSCHTIEQAVQAQGADYLGVGPYAVTQSKQILRSPLGLAGLAPIVRATSLPICAIGGIGFDDLPGLAQLGVRMVAVIGAFAQANELRVVAEQWVQRWAVLTTTSVA